MSRADRILCKRHYGSVLIVRCKLNGNYHGRFIVDTGAAITAITPQVAENLGLEITQSTRQQEITSIHQTIRVPLITLKKFQVGGQEVNNLDVVIFPLSANLQVDGLLGVNFLRRFRYNL